MLEEHIPSFRVLNGYYGWLNEDRTPGRVECEMGNLKIDLECGVALFPKRFEKLFAQNGGTSCGVAECCSLNFYRCAFIAGQAEPRFVKSAIVKLKQILKGPEGFIVKDMLSGHEISL
uniref:Uncharacterized protein n=1 Tax=Chromera velia CCMP2878 TaxID=1169474 RepID=A0A0G4I2X6_9ALVE|eukprot:Cvel_10522.t1-p1 / transcript=Cvel_10522.t1 / gene=Cvel_10522 / organism=Chromera_velia_CCMP2878 / gene_product=hypothetical protein / transcript_product=hypothetical protein / location=Cvel_scaffold636:64623-64973(-) / protein_length=117 / sequence_SO=supercontig / SO=protein_coding / is_pseudo=false